ncbi:MAG: glycoside hydrolase family 25 protein [Eubacterium sp.]
MAVNTKRKKELDVKAKRVIAIAAVALAAVTFLSAVIASFVGSKRTADFFNTSRSVVSGIDVSEHNGEIDWKTAAKSIDFAFIRVGYRGYGTGKIAEDKYAKQNLKDAEKAGVPVGVYFYSQAVNEQEAREEAEYVLDFIDGYDVELPVVIDFEYPSGEGGLTVGRLVEAGLNPQQSTQIINAFCSEISKEGYTPALYASTAVMNKDIDMAGISTDTVIWVADYSESPSYGGDYDIWQYSKTGSCDGVGSSYVDLNYWYLKD